MAPTAPARAQAMSFSKSVDLTHTLWPDFPTFFGEPGLEMERMFSFEDDGFNQYRWHLVEHTGTHMDAPIHFSADQNAADEIPVDKLVVPLVIVDIAARAADDPDAQLTPDDIEAWIESNGDLPDGCCVAMHSGWGEHVRSDKFRNADEDGVMHFPGFHPDASAMLLERNVNGIAVDTMSLDHGPSQDFATHYSWLPAGRWGLEAVANLADLPAVGATMVVGGPKIEGATGGPSRIIALV
ncbi:MAG: cyclase family protein [Gammaproteobacteria bacterium]